MKGIVNTLCNFAGALTAFLSVSMLASCLPEESAPEVPQPPLLVLLLNDVSASAAHLDLPPQELSAMILADSSRGSIQLAGLLIDGHSFRQTPYFGEVIRPGLQGFSGKETIYERADIERHNANMRRAFGEAAVREASGLLAHLQQARIEPHTDLYGALRLAQKIAGQPGFSRHEIRIILLSDLLHDLPGEQAPENFQFPSNVGIFLIGRAGEARIDSLFPANEVTELAAFRASFFHP